MHVTLVNPPQVFSRFQVASGITPPLGVAYLAGYLREHGLAVAVVDALGEAPSKVTPFRKQAFLRGLDLAETAAAIPRETHLVGISNLFTSAWPAVAELAAAIKQRLPDVPIIVGGPHPAALPAECLAEDAVDFVGIGEGERPLLDLCGALEQGRDFSDLEGLAFLGPDGEAIVRPQTKRTLIQDLGEIPFPARDLLPMENYVQTQEAHGPVSSRWTSILSSRGCPYGCTFCESRLTRWRARRAEEVVDEIEHCVKTWGIEDFHFEDDNMTIRTDRILEMAAELRRRGLKIRWQTPNGIRASVTDQETLRAMRDSGCHHITLAPESGSQRVLENVIQKGRDFELDQVIRVAEDAHQLGMKVAAYFIIGLPGELPEEVEQTITYARELARVGVDEVGFSLFIPLPGTPLWDLASHKIDDYLDLLTIDDLNCSVSFNESMDDQALHRLRRKAYSLFFLTRLRHHPRAFLRTASNVLRERQETKTDRVLISLVERTFGMGSQKRPVLAYPYDGVRTMRVLLDTEAVYAFRHGLRRTIGLLRPRSNR
ncbi:MAG: radical SAM protein [Myxococcota bacterium]|nr:radical SAM protein [Myxococcota bacterium]